MHKGNGGRGTLDICPDCLIQYSSCAFIAFIFQAPLNPDTISSSLKAQKKQSLFKRTELYKWYFKVQT